MGYNPYIDNMDKKIPPHELLYTERPPVIKGAFRKKFIKDLKNRIPILRQLSLATVISLMLVLLMQIAMDEVSKSSSPGKLLLDRLNRFCDRQYLTYDAETNAISIPNQEMGIDYCSITNLQSYLNLGILPSVKIYKAGEDEYGDPIMEGCITLIDAATGYTNTFYNPGTFVIPPEVVDMAQEIYVLTATDPDKCNNLTSPTGVIHNPRYWVETPQPGENTFPQVTATPRGQEA